MSTQTRRKFLKMTTASAAALPFVKAFSSAVCVPPADQNPTGRVSLRLTAGDQRYAPATPLAWQSADRAQAADTIILRGISSKQPILGFGAGSKNICLASAVSIHGASPN